MLKLKIINVLALALISINANSQNLGKWLTDSSNGCKIWDDVPQPLESIKYEGFCAKKIAQGQGKVTFFINGLVNQIWDANWKDGKAEGKLTITYPDGEKYYGELLNGKRNGQGLLIYQNGSKYEGDFKNGIISGNGSLTIANGSKYTGQFENNKFNGRGTFLYADNSKYIGDFKDNQLHGYGTYYDPNGTVKATGLFENGTFIPEVSLNKLEVIAECIAATSIIEADFTIRGDYKNEQSAKKVREYLSNRFYHYASIYTRKISIDESKSIYELVGNSAKKYTYMDDRSQMNYAVSLSKNSNCLDQAK